MERYKPRGDSELQEPRGRRFLRRPNRHRARRLGLHSKSRDSKARHPAHAALLSCAFRSSIELAIAHGLRSIAFPAISCGVYGYPMQDAATISAEVVRESAWNLDEIRFVLFSEDAVNEWTRGFA